MLTQQHKNARVQWAIKHKNDDWSRIIFTDETCYQLFRNIIRRWSLKPSAEVKRIPKNRQKIMVWGGISIKGLIGYHSFRNIMDSPYFVRILQDHLIPNAKNQFGRRWRLQMDNDPKHRSRLALEQSRCQSGGEFMGNHQTSYRKTKTRKSRTIKHFFTRRME